MYHSWNYVSPEHWFDLAAITGIIFAVFVPKLGSELRRPKVFALLLLFCAAHLAVCVHFLVRGVWVRRPLAFAPIAVAEIFAFTYLLIWLGGARYEDFAQSLRARRKR